MKPNVEVVKEWVKALRSGKYKQGKLRLRCEDSFSCLGVLCDLNAKDEHGKWHKIEGQPCYFYGRKTLQRDEGALNSFLPKFVQKWTGVIGSDRTAKIRQTTLASMNDDGRSFEEIADFIERACLTPKKP